MFVRYVCGLLIGATVDNRILYCGVMAGAFALTFGYSARRDGLWRSEAAPSTPAAARLPETAVVPTGAAAPAAAANAPAAMTPAATTPAPATPPAEFVPSEPESPPDVDGGETRGQRDRAAERGSRSH